MTPDLEAAIKQCEQLGAINADKSLEWDQESLRSRVRSLIPTSGIPDHVVETLLANPRDESEDYRRLKEYMRTGTFLVLHGPVGTKKTTSACRYLFHRVRGKFVDATGYTEAHRDVSKQWHAADLLVLDDLGQENVEWGTKKINWLLRDRYNKERQTIITTNLSPGQVWDRYGNHIYDRIMEMGGFLEFEQRTREWHG